jgi:hypothetical protein
LRVNQSAEKAGLNIEVVKTVLLHDRDGKEMTGHRKSRTNRYLNFAMDGMYRP